MKRVISIFMTVSILLSMFVFLAPRTFATPGPYENVIFQDNFESYPVGSFPSGGGWQLVWSGASSFITNSYSYSPTQSFQLTGEYMWSCVVKRDFSSNSTYIGYEGCIMATSTSADGGIGFFNQYIAQWGRFYAGIGFGGGNIGCGSYSAPIVPGAWYKVKLILDKDTRLYDAWINGTLMVHNGQEPNDPHEILSLEVSTGWSGHPVYFDDVKISSESPEQSISVSIAPANLTTCIGGSATYEVTVGNLALTAENVTLNITGLDPSWYNLSNSQLTMMAGETDSVQLAVTIPEEPANARFYAFQITAQDASTQVSASANLTVNSNPTLDNLEPSDDAVIGSTSILISWTTAILATSEVYVKPAGGSVWSYFAGENGTSHFVQLSNLTRNQDYTWYAQSQTSRTSVSSETRTLHVGNGISFSQSVYVFNVARDYAQCASVSVINNDTQAHVLLLQALNPYQDLIVGFVSALVCP